MSVLIRGGRVVRSDGSGQEVEADVRLEGDRIAEVAPRLRRKSGEDIIDARNCAIMPGFVQAHVHLCQTLIRGMADDLPLLPWLRERIWPLEAAHDGASLRASARLGLAEMILAGTTGILDMGTVHHHDEVFTAMHESGIRGFSGKAMMDVGDNALTESTADSLHESRALASRWHGKADGRLGYAFAPRFILSCSEELIRGAVDAHRALEGSLLHTHAAEHAAEREAVKALLGQDDVAALERLGVCGERAVLAHCVQIRASEMRKMAKLGTRAVHCPSANLKLASGIAKVVEMREAGICVALGADGAPCNNRMDPWTEMRSAALLAKSRGDASALSAGEALSLATREGARALGWDDVGSIEPGFKADLLVARIDRLHHEPGGSACSRLVYSTRASDVEHVFANGVPLVEGGKLLRASEAAIAKEARKQGALLQARAFGTPPRA